MRWKICVELIVEAETADDAIEYMESQLDLGSMNVDTWALVGGAVPTEVES